MDKNQLRAELRALRNGIGPEDRHAADAAICNRVCSLAPFQNARIVFTYLSFGAEVDTRELVERAWQAGKTVALPRCVGPHSMRWFTVSNLDGLERSPFGVDEPPVDEQAEIMPGACSDAVAIVPGLSFDVHGFRLGYGGGFYDAFLPTFAGTSIGLCRKAQLSDRPLPIEALDVPVDIVVTD